MKNKILLISALLTITSNVIASSGSALLPYWHKDSSSSMLSALHITNTTDTSVVVYLRLKNFDGTDYDETTETSTTNFSVSNGSGDPLSTGGMTIDPNETAIINISNGSLKYGYGLIEWDSTNSHHDALIAFLRWEGTTGGSHIRNVFPVNDLKPF